MRKKTRPPSKHMAYFALRDACQSGECPICRLVSAHLENFFDALLYENINDHGFRRRFRADFGFCNAYAHKFAGYCDGLAIALTHRDLLRATLDALEQKGRRALDPSAPTGCLACQLAAEEEERNLTVLAAFLPDPEFRTALSESAGLCLPHYRQLARRARDLPDWLAAFQQRQYADLLQQLDRYVESCNFSLGERRPVLTREETLVWQRAVKMLFGYEGRHESSRRP